MRYRRSLIANTRRAWNYLYCTQYILETARHVYAASKYYHYPLGIWFTKRYGPHQLMRYKYQFDNRSDEFFPSNYGKLAIQAESTIIDRLIEDINRGQISYPIYGGAFTEAIVDLAELVERMEGVRYGEVYYDHVPLRIYSMVDMRRFGEFIFYYLPGPRPRLIGDYTAQAVRLTHLGQIGRDVFPGLIPDDVHTVCVFEKLPHTVPVKGAMSIRVIQTWSAGNHVVDIPAVVAWTDYRGQLPYGRYTALIDWRRTEWTLHFWPAIGVIDKRKLIGVEWETEGNFLVSRHMTQVFPYGLFMYEYGRSVQRYPKRELRFLWRGNYGHLPPRRTMEGRSLWAIWPRRGPVCVEPFTYIAPVVIGDPAGRRITQEDIRYGGFPYLSAVTPPDLRHRRY